MSLRNPTYITKSRHGIWYFQFWIPIHTRQNGKTGQRLIRRSLKTRDRRRALGLARRWWLLMMNDSDIDLVSAPNDLEKIDQGAEKQDFLYWLGAKVSREMKEHGVNPENQFELNSYLEWLPPQHEEAFFFFVDVQASLEHESRQGDEQELRILSSEEIGDIVEAKFHEAKFHEKNYSDAENPTIDQLLEEWLDFIKYMNPSSFQSYAGMASQFCQIVKGLNGNSSPRANALSKDMIRTYKAILAGIPKKSITEDLSFDEIVNLHGEPKGQTTINGYYDNVAHFLDWIRDNRFPIDGDLIGLMRKKKPVKRSDKKQRVPFDGSDLIKIFESNKYRHGKFTKTCDFWAPLIALFTGATQSEICQLYVSDVRDLDNIWYFDINDSEDKQLKNEKGRLRTVPIHPQLIKLGFLDYVEYQKHRGNKRLFPAEQRTKRGLFGRYGRRFRKLRKNVGAGPRNKQEFRDFHSFRHLVPTKLADAGAKPWLLDAIGGWSSKERSIREKNYTHAKRLQLQIDDLKKLKYAINFDAIRKWDHQEFMNRPEQFRDWDTK